MKVKLEDARKYLSSQCQSGWLAAALHAKHNAAKFKLESLDSDIAYTLNALAKSVGINRACDNNGNNNGKSKSRSDNDHKNNSNNKNIRSSSNNMDGSYTYESAVDVRSAVESLGGTEAIYYDSAKERTLARLIQADGFEVHSELAGMVGEIQRQGGDVSLYKTTKSISNASVIEIDKSRRSILGNDDAGSVRNSTDAQQTWLGRLCHYFCCCCKCDKNNNINSNAKYGRCEKRQSNIQLKESLIKNSHLDT